MPQETHEARKIKGSEITTSELINCGERNIQTLNRIALRDVCERHGIKEGAAVEVFIRKMNKPQKLLDFTVPEKVDLCLYRNSIPITRIELQKFDLIEYKSRED